MTALDQPPADRSDGAHPAQVLSALASPDRLRALAALTLAGTATVADVAARAEVSEAVATAALRRLAGAKVVAEDGGGAWSVSPDAFAGAARRASRLRAEREVSPRGLSAADAAVVRAYMRDGRLHIPVQLHKRRVVLDWLSQEFEPGRVYEEAEVNAILERSHPDTAGLRRAMVDEGFMDRRHGVYWRTGGTFEVD